MRAQQPHIVRNRDRRRLHGCAATALASCIAFFTTLPLPSVAQAQAYAPAASERQTEAPCDPGGRDSRAECGWWWGESDFERLKNEIERRQAAASAPPPPPAAIDCKNADQWVAPCGFIDPQGNFAFQAKQRDALFQNMIMSSNDFEAVQQFQRYHRWVVTQAVHIADVWEFNLAQNAELDPSVQTPLTSYGLKVLEREKGAARSSFLELLKEDGAFLVWFTRSDCRYCHDMLRTIISLEQETGLRVWNASLDDHCMPGFEDRCMTGDQTSEPARSLEIAVVPSILLHMPKERGWIKLSNGVVSRAQIISRLELFASAAKAAVVNGVDNAKGFRPSLDFKKKLAELSDRGAVFVSDTRAQEVSP